MPTPSSSLLNSSFYSHKLHGNQPSIPKPVSYKSRRGRSRSASPTSSSSSSYSTYNTSSFRKPPKIEIATASLASDRMKRFSKIDDDDDYLLDHKINAFKSLERLNRPTTGKYRPSTDLGSDYLTSSKSDYSSGSTARYTPRSTRSTLGDSTSWDTTGRNYTTSTSPVVSKSSASGSKESPRSRESSPVSNSQTPLSRKIAEFLHRTDHIADAKVGAKNNESKIDDRTSSRLSTYSGLGGDDLKPSSRPNSRLSNREEERSSSRLSTLGDELRSPSRLKTERETRSMARVHSPSDAKRKSSQPHLDIDEETVTPHLGGKARETRSLSRFSRADSESKAKASRDAACVGDVKSGTVRNVPRSEKHGRVSVIYKWTVFDVSYLCEIII